MPFKETCSTLLLICTLICARTVLAQFGGSTPKGLHFVGVGYNLLEGNPEGGDQSNGGVDPGILFTRKVFKLTWDTNKESVDKQYKVPDQVSFAPRQSCVQTNQKEVFSGSKSYQEKLNVDASSNGGYDSDLFNVAFTLSARYEKIQKETSKYNNVFFEEKHVCNRGRARYQLDLAPMKKFPVSPDFAAAVCSLPTYYDTRRYFNFIERWGTHIIVEVELGTKTIERYKTSQTEFTKYAMENAGGSVSMSGSYMGFSGSIKVDMTKFKESMSENTKFGENKVVFRSGGEDLPEPIGVKLVPIGEAFNDNFFASVKEQSNSQCFRDMVRKRGNMIKALHAYPKMKRAVEPKDPDIRIPLTWPQGTYGLPMPTTGCPQGRGFRWHTGTRLHDTESNNQWSYRYHLAGSKGASRMEQKFCMKTQSQGTKYDLLWPKGQYCIFKKRQCPEGLKEGFITWDDQSYSNDNTYSGTLPDGKYDHNTNIEFCCRTDGHATNSINLPNDKPFVLFKSNTHECQHVHGMGVSEEYFKWDCQNLFPRNKEGGSRPYGEIGRNVKLDYCYYYPKRY